jgi:hypothetical protein
MQGTAHVAGTPTAHQGGPLRDPLGQAPPRSREPRAHDDATPTPQGGAHPHHCGEGLCGAAGVSPVTPCACSSTANALSPRRGAGCTLDSLSCDPTGLGGGARPVEHHPCHCNSVAAVPARAGARQAL